MRTISKRKKVKVQNRFAAICKAFKHGQANNLVTFNLQEVEGFIERRKRNQLTSLEDRYIEKLSELYLENTRVLS